jgi:hypothetical protein
MAIFVGHPITSGGTTDVHTTEANKLGTRAKDATGNEYIFLKGVASVVAGTAVTYDENFATARTVTGARGPVAIAMAAIDATTKYGWFQIFGKGSGDFAGAAVAGAKVYSASTGKVDDAVVAGDQIDGAFVGATVAGAGAGDILLCYPSMNGQG